MSTRPIELTVDGATRTAEVEPRLLLVQLLRDALGLTGTRIGCDTSHCGACTVIVDGRATKSCTVLAVSVDGSDITTIAGLDEADGRDALQRAFVEGYAIQCGYCTPGMVMSAVRLLAQDPDPSDDAIREAIAGNICRCTGYGPIVDAIRTAAVELRRERAGAAGSVAPSDR